MKETRACLGTIVEITVADQDKPHKIVKGAMEKAFAEIRRIENTLSKFNPQSDISRINVRAYTQPVEASPETIRLIKKSIVLSQLTDGAFDITILPLMEIWSFSAKDKQPLPETEPLKLALSKVGYQNIKIANQEKAVFLTQQGMALDLGGIAKGYAVDRAVAVLKQEGLKNVLVNAGGDIYALGRHSGNKSWRIAVQHPRKQEAILAVLELQDRAIATSGDYQKYVENSATRYSHIINPKTGYPCQDLPASVTVLAEDCCTADALATAIFVLGPEKGIELVNRLEGTEAIVVSVEGRELATLVSQGIEGKIEFADNI